MRSGFAGVPTARSALLALAGAALLAATLGAPDARSTLVALDAVLLLAVALDCCAARRIRIEVRRLPHGKLNLGVPNAITLRVRNLDGASARVRLKDASPVSRPTATSSRLRAADASSLAISRCASLGRGA